MNFFSAGRGKSAPAVNERQSRAVLRYKGNVSITYIIKGATPGYRVKVSVSVKKGSRTGSCSTSFTPHR